MLSSFRTRIVVWYFVVALLSLFSYHLIAIQVIRSFLFHEIDNSLQVEAEWVSTLLRGYDPELSPEKTHNELTTRSRSNPRKEFIEIYGSDGSLFYRSPNVSKGGVLRLARSLPPDEAVTLPAFQKRPVRLVSRNSGPYQICIGYPLTDVDAVARKLVVSFLVLLPATLLLLALGGSFLVSRFLRPIREISACADELMRQPLSEEPKRIPVRGNDEIGVLVGQINELVGRMRKSLRQVLSFATLASHELRTPLANMRNELEGALRPDLPADDLRKIVASSYDETLRMSNTVDELLSLGTLEAGTFRLHRSIVSFKVLMEDFREEAVCLVQENGIGIVMPGGPDVAANLDVVRMKQVLFNLLDNAAKHSGNGCRIRLAWVESDGRIELEFSDNGVGIAPHQLSRIFDPFFRGSSNEDRASGTGLGLLLVKRIVEAHGGTIRAESQVGAGTTFRISLPAGAESRVARPSPERSVSG